MRTYHPQNDGGSLHVLGNGKLCVYEQGPEIIELFGAPYSANAVCRLSCGQSAGTWREPKTAIYTHTLENGAQMVDFVDSQTACFVRKITTDKPFSMKLTIHPGFEKIRCDTFTCYRARPGQTIFGPYVTPAYANYIFFVQGAGRLKNEVLTVNCGETILYICGLSDYGQCLELAEATAKLPYDVLLSRTRAWWQAFSARRVALPQPLDAVADNIAVLLKAQQDDCGGVLAGSNYHLAYVRDMYGVSRGFIALGYVDEAKKIMRYYKRIWDRYGKIDNAQAMGYEGIFHVHENDNTEITGYLIIAAFDIYKADGDKAFLNEMLPMLKWAMEAQISTIQNNMLPFNGDETYVAGGILPRHTLMHGAAEATLLFIISGELYCGYTGDGDGFMKTVEQVKAHYKENFLENGFLVTNNPARLEKENYPRFRFGVCEKCGRHYWTEKSANARYLCPECISTGDLEPAPDTKYLLQSVALVPFYMSGSLISKEDIAPMLEKAVSDYEKSGVLPSRPDGNRNCGYDFGLFLYMLTELGHPLAEKVFDQTLSLLDDAGAWVEYYDSGVPAGTRCRPWESGVNICALIHYLNKKNA